MIPTHQSRTSQEISVALATDSSRWNAYVEGNRAASNYHRWVWKSIIETTFEHHSYYLAASCGDTIHGILPLFYVKSLLFSDSLVSMPFSSYGGVLADTPEVQGQLLSKATELARALKVHHIELRQDLSFPADWHDTTAKVIMEAPLPGTTGELLERLSKNLRHNIRRAQKSGIQARWSGVEGVAPLYRIWACNMRNLGTPAYTRRLFENICLALPNETRTLTLWDRNNCVAGGLISTFRDTVELPWSASLPESRKKYAHVLLFWAVMEWAIMNGYKSVDLGRCTPGGGTYEFKKHWQCEERPMHSYYWLAPGAEIPEMRPDSAQYRWASRVWKHLPLFIANRLGPPIVRFIP